MGLTSYTRLKADRLVSLRAAESRIHFDAFIWNEERPRGNQCQTQEAPFKDTFLSSIPRNGEADRVNSSEMEETILTQVVQHGIELS